MSLRELTEQAILHHYGPATVVVNERGDISYIHGRTGKYLEPAAGEAGMNILRMAREGLKLELATALKKASTKKEVAAYPGVRVKTEGGFAHIDLTVRPIQEGADHDGNRLFLVLFEAAKVPYPATSDGIPDAKDPQNERLQEELRAKEEYLQAAIEEIETSNEELRSTNEELQSANEEHQSTNEELETSREELQSVNEELSTVNNELHEKVAALAQANNDMNNLFAGSGVGTVFVNRDLRILRFTPAITKIINLIKTDVGRPLGDIASKLVGYDLLVRDAQTVLDTLVPSEAEVQTGKGAYYLLRIRPYRTLENVIEGAAITFVDITEQKRVQEELTKSKAIARLAAVVHDSNDAVVMQDFGGRILAWNPAAERMYGWSEAEALKLNIRDILPPGRQDEALALVKQLSRECRVHPLQMQRVTKTGGFVDVWITYSCLLNEVGEPYAIATTEKHLPVASTAKDGAR